MVLDCPAPDGVQKCWRAFLFPLSIWAKGNQQIGMDTPHSIVTHDCSGCGWQGFGREWGFQGWLLQEGWCRTQLAPDSSTTAPLQAKAEPIIQASGTDRSPKRLRPKGHRIPCWECRLCRTHIEIWEKSGMEAAAEWNYFVPVVHTAHYVGEGTECNLWWDQGAEDRCLWQKVRVSLWMGWTDTWR